MTYVSNGKRQCLDEGDEGDHDGLAYVLLSKLPLLFEDGRLSALRTLYRHGSYRGGSSLLESAGGVRRLCESGGHHATSL